MRGGDTHYTAVAGREPLRAAIAQAHARRTGQPVEADNVIFLAGAQNALFTASLCLAGPGDEVLAFEPLYPTYPATIEASGARMVRVPVQAGGRVFGRISRRSRRRSRPARERFSLPPPTIRAGIVMSAADLAAIGELARRHALWIVVDEVYAGLAPGRPGAESCREPARASGHSGEPVEDARDARLARRLDGWPESADRATPRRSRSRCSTACPASCRKQRSPRSASRRKPSHACATIAASAALWCSRRSRRCRDSSACHPMPGCSC